RRQSHFREPSDLLRSRVSCSRHELGLKGMGRYVPRSGWAEEKTAAAEKQQSITLVNQSFDERKIVVLRSDASDKTAKQNESDEHFRLAEYPFPIYLSRILAKSATSGPRRMHLSIPIDHREFLQARLLAASAQLVPLRSWSFTPQ